MFKAEASEERHGATSNNAQVAADRGSNSIRGGKFAAVAILLVALNLRPAVATIGAVLPDITRDLGLGALGSSALTTIPVIAFGLFGVLAPAVSRRLGTDASVLLILTLLAAGLALRGIADATALFIGQAVACVSIGVSNVLLPALMKRDFPSRLPLMTGLYTMALCGGAALGAGITVPLAHALGDSWARSLAIWAAPAVLAAIIWAGRLRHSERAIRPSRMRGGGIWRDPLAWQVTLFMGLQSSLAFTVFGWFAPMLRDRGFSAKEAGYVLSISVLVQAGAALFAPLLAARGKDQRLGCIVAVGLCVAGLMGCMFAPLSTIWVWAIVLGIAQGSLFALALMLIVLRAPSAELAGDLSSMAQGIGYTIAAAGPMVSGLIRGWTGSWTPVAFFWCAIATGAAASAFGAGRNIHIRGKQCSHAE